MCLEISVCACKAKPTGLAERVNKRKVKIHPGIKKRSVKQSVFWDILDLNRGPKDYESSALTAELMAQNCTKKYVVKDNILEVFGQREVYCK